MQPPHDFLSPTSQQLSEIFVPSRAHVDLWRGTLLQEPTVVERCAAVMNEDELARTRRYRFDELRRRFTVTRGGLRILLAKYLKCEPREVTFVYNGHGRPELDPHLHPNANTLQFNLSHTGDDVFYGVTGLDAIGVDVERHRKQDRLDDLARRYFAKAEFETWSALQGSEKVEGFFYAWTRKEAYIKAHGRGMSYPLNQFVVSLRPGETARLLATLDAPHEAAKWRMEDVVWQSGYAAAVVASAGNWSLRKWHIQSLLQ